MPSNALNKLAVQMSAMATIAAIGVATAGLSASAAQRAVAPQDQAVNETAKTDRLTLPDVGLTVVRTEKANRKFRTRKPEGDFKFELTDRAVNDPARGAVPNREITTGTVDETSGPTARAKDDPGAIVEPAANAEETPRNFAEEPAERNPSSWSAWSYSKGLMERTDRRARFLWNRLLDRK